VYRYVALAWNADDPDAQADASAIRVRLSTEWPGARTVLWERGLAAFASSAHFSSWQTLERPGAGIIFGRLFRTGRETELSAPGLDEWERIRTTRGKSLLDSWWGRYVAIARSASGAGVSVLRDPSGGLPCFIARHRRVWVIFSDIGACKRILSLSINWQYVSHFLQGMSAVTSQTGLLEVTEAQPGECVLMRCDGKQRSRLWNPLEAAIDDPVEDPLWAGRAVRETVERCVNAWASMHGSLVHMLSGGLDSTIVLSCLARAPSKPRISCLHVVSSVEHEMELHYARLAAEHTGCELRELKIDACTADLPAWLSRLHPAVRPLSTIYEALTGETCITLAQEMAATAVTSGAAGDSLFFQPAAEFAVADHVRRRGLRASAFGVAWNAARVSGGCFWPMLWHGILQRSAKCSEVDAESLDRRSPPGLSMQLASLSAAPPFYGSFGHTAREPDRCAVLLSQPLMELCLRIPSDVWIAGGCDRALVRQAFASELPGAIVCRTEKGSANACYGQLVESNAEFIRQELLGGVLAEQGCIDAKWLVSQLAGSRLHALEHDRILHRYLCADFWARHWQHEPIRSRASAVPLEA
jgi:asparagine synthase (glutamine-hydrolysing)